MATTLAQKLQIKPGQRLAVLNAPEGYVDKLAEALEGITVSAEAAGQPDAVLLFVNSLAESERLAPGSLGAMRPEGLFWIAYPKGSSGVKTDANRDRLWNAVQAQGWRPVRQVALDEVWSAIRYRPEEKVGR